MRCVPDAILAKNKAQSRVPLDHLFHLLDPQRHHDHESPPSADALCFRAEGVGRALDRCAPEERRTGWENKGVEFLEILKTPLEVA